MDEPKIFEEYGVVVLPAAGAMGSFMCKWNENSLLSIACNFYCTWSLRTHQIAVFYKLMLSVPEKNGYCRFTYGSYRLRIIVNNVFSILDPSTQCDSCSKLA